MVSVEQFVASAGNCWPAWPGAEPARFSGFIAQLQQREPQLGELCAGDLWLAFFAAAGHPHALFELERRCFAGLAAYLCARRASPTQAEEAVQRLRQRLLVATDTGEIRLLTYRGRGALASWVRVAALRTWLNLEREHARERPTDTTEQLVEHAAADFELEFLKGQYRESFRQAFLEEVGALEASDRLLLKLHYLDRASMEEVGRVVGAHRITVLRRLERIREQLAVGTKSRLSAQHRLSSTELESVLRMIQSHLDMSLRIALTEVR